MNDSTHLTHMIFFDEIPKDKKDEINAWIKEKHRDTDYLQFLAVIKEKNKIYWPKELNFIIEKHGNEYIYSSYKENVSFLKKGLIEDCDITLNYIKKQSEEAKFIKIKNKITLTKMTMQNMELD